MREEKRKRLSRKSIFNKVFLIITILVLMSVGSIFYFIIFKQQEKDSDSLFLKPGNLKLEVYLNDKKQEKLPKKSNEIVFENLECSVLETASWDSNEWELSINQESITEEVNCKINFRTEANTGELDIDLVDGMIPVSFDKEGKTVKTDSSNVSNNWYDYDNFKWANMVLVNEESRDKYKKIAIGEEILEEDILTYFVWIPRYRYKLFNTDNNAITERTINIEFEKEETEISNGSSNGEWLTHPAFSFGDTLLNGFWVGKFMTNPDEGSLCQELSNVTNCNVTDITPMIKPNMDAWRNIDVANLFTIAQYIKSNSKYGMGSSSIFVSK